MLKNRGAALVVAAILILGGYGTWISFSSHVFPHNPAPKASNQEAGDSCAEDKKLRSWWVRSTCDPLTVYTGFLAFFTFVLVGVSFGQFYFLIRADGTARITADAARKSAEAALLALDHPWLYIEFTKNIIVKPIPGKERTVAGFRITNYGKAPALLKSAKASLFYSPGPFLKDAFPVKPLPKTMKEFPTAGQLDMFINTTGVQADENDPTFSAHIGTTNPKFRRVAIDNGIVIPNGGKTDELIFQSVLVDNPDDSLPIEYAGKLYLTGKLIYQTPIDEIEIITFTYEARGGFAIFQAIYGPPYNERKKIS